MTPDRRGLASAITELTQPGTSPIHRADPIADPHAAQLLADDRATERELATRHTAHLRAGHHHQAARTLAALHHHRARAHQRRRRIATTTTSAPLPPLLDQLCDAIASSGNTSGGNSAAAAHRCAIGLDAALIVHSIEHTTGHHGPRTANLLAASVTSWAHTVADPDTAAALAQDWVTRARAVLDPPKRWHLIRPRPCPACGKTTATITEDGERVRRPALEFDPRAARVRCLRCPATWTTEAQLRSLERALFADDAPTEHRRRA